MRTARPGAARTAMRTDRGPGRLDSLTSASASRRIEPAQRRLHPGGRP